MRSTTRWTVDLPEGLREVRVDPPPDCASMAHLRGEIAPGVETFGVLSTQARGDRSAVERATELAASLLECAGPRGVDVPGASGAARIDGLLEMDEGWTPDGVERISLVVAERGDELVTFTVRTRPSDDPGDAVDRLLASFAVRPAG